jgi:hypothetical protein
MALVSLNAYSQLSSHPQVPAASAVPRPAGVTQTALRGSGNNVGSDGGRLGATGFRAIALEPPSGRYRSVVPP